MTPRNNIILKSIGLFLVSSIFTTLVFYPLWAFVQNSIYPSAWSIESRAFYAFIQFLITGLLFLLLVDKTGTWKF